MKAESFLPIGLVFAILPVAASAAAGEELLSGLPAQERRWVEASCPRSLGPSLYLSCVQRETSALKSGIPDVAGLSADQQAWVRQSCPPSLGPSLYASCVTREMSALRGGSSNLDSLDPDTRRWIEQSCPRSLGPSLYTSCIQRELGAFGKPPRQTPSQTYAPRTRPTPTAPDDPIPTVRFTWPSWTGPRPMMPPSIAREALPAAEVFRIGSPSVYVVAAESSHAELAKRGSSVVFGSAVAVSDRLLITNCHIFEGRPAVLITRNHEVGQVRLLHADPNTDRCYLESESLRLRPVSGVRSYDDLVVGERAYSIGAPRGLENTLAEGLVSGLRKSSSMRLIQTSAPISPGSSGGALFDSRGNLIGITTLFLREAQNLNFAVAAEDFWK
jgi:hypothetical protein